MPRLAPDGNRCREHRLTMGTIERQALRTMVKERQADRVQKYVTAFAPAIMIGTAGFGAIYFLSKSIDNIARAWSGLPLDNIQQSIRKGGSAIKGLNADGSFPTLLAVENGPTYQEGHVRVEVPGLTGGFGSTAFILSKKRTEIVVVGNFNKDAKFVNELSEGWLPYTQYQQATQDGREYVS